MSDMLNRFWFSVADGGSALKQHWWLGKANWTKSLDVLLNKTYNHAIIYLIILETAQAMCTIY